jgi:hydroxyethylthiazole kinase
MSNVYKNVIEKVREKNPVVHNITNYVVMNWTANCLLAAGASPVMAHAPEEMQAIVSIAGALVVNIGTLSSSWVESMHKAFGFASARGIPTVLDPVGAGASAFRTETARALIAEYKPSCIRCNASELLAIVSEKSNARGVDSSDSSLEALEAAREFSLSSGAVVCVSGAIDYVVNGNETVAVGNGHPIMTKVTGMGCAASALIGACLAVHDNRTQAVAAAMLWTGIAGEIAEQNSTGPGSFQTHYLDALYRLSAEQFSHRQKIQ